jgi:hypothetical protein
MEHARKLIVWVSGRHPSLSLLVRARSTIALSKDRRWILDIIGA